MSAETQIHTAEVDRELVRAVDSFCGTVMPWARIQSDPDEAAVADPDFNRADLERAVAEGQTDDYAVKADNTDSKAGDTINLATNPPSSALNSEIKESDDGEATVIGPH